MSTPIKIYPTLARLQNKEKKPAVTSSIKAFETSSYLLLLLWARSPLSSPELQEQGLLCTEKVGHRGMAARGATENQGAREQGRDRAWSPGKGKDWQRPKETEICFKMGLPLGASRGGGKMEGDGE